MNKFLKKLLLASVALVAVTAGNVALAADMPVKAPPAVVYGWTGFYLGGNVGLSVGRNPASYPAFTSLGPARDNELFNLAPIGGIGGGEIGYNWQPAPNLVAGVEADFQLSGQRDSNTCVTECTPDGFLATPFTQKLPWLGTARARLGWTNGPALFYATVGAAFGKVTTDFNLVRGADVATGSFSQTKAGWTAGGGVEAFLFGNWTGKIEYLYMDLGTVAGGPVFGTGVLAADTFAFSSTVHDHIVRLGVNYKFGDPVYAPAAHRVGVYKAPAAVVAADWSGVYVGGNLGLSVARNSSAAPISAPGVPPFIIERFNLSPIGVIGGGQLGTNWQIVPSWVLGVEADFQGSGQSDSTTCVLHCSPDGTSFETFTQRLSWFGTVRARAGWTNGLALFYATGGWAYGKVTTDLNFAEQTAPVFGFSTAAGSFSQVKSGWTAGGGVEVQLAGNWTGKIEYLYLDLGTVTGSVVAVGGQLAGQIYAFSSRVQDHIVRVGLNYRFGPAAIYAKY